MDAESIWLCTVGLGQQFGGVAHVARCSVDAITGEASSFHLRRIVSLLDSVETLPPVQADPGIVITPCCGSRVRFTSRVFSQLFARPDMILFDHLDIAQCQTLLPNRLRAPYAVWIHGIEVWKELPARKLQALKDADLLVFNSHFTQRRFESYHGNQFPSQVVHLTGSNSEFDPAALSQPRKPWILTVGRLEPDRPKGHQQILDAMPKISSVMPDVQWHVVGTGTAIESFRRDVAASPAKDRIHVHGFLENDWLDQLFRECRVFAMPSFGEGFGIVYLQAMESGCVPLGSTIDAAPEVIGDAGICLDPNDGDRISGDLIELLTEPHQRFQIRSEAAVARAASFGRQQFQAKLLEALNVVVQPDSSNP